jgi:hypothetical protein
MIELGDLIKNVFSLVIGVYILSALINVLPQSGLVFDFGQIMIGSVIVAAILVIFKEVKLI